MTDDEPTAPDHERPTDPSPPPSFREPPGNFEVGPTLRFPLPGYDPDAPASALIVVAVDHEAGTVTIDSVDPEGETPPEVSDPSQVAPDGGETGALSFEPFRGIDREPGVQPFATVTAPTSYRVDAAGNVVPGPHVPTRPWHDYGKDTGARLRVKGIVDATPKPEPMEDHDGWRERHARLERAKAEGDEHTVGKMLPQYLDELHSTSPQVPVTPLDWDELEPAMAHELKEWGRAHGVRSGSIGVQKFFDASCAVRIVMRDGTFEMRMDRRSVKSAWREAGGNARRAAAALVMRGTEELALARRRELITIPDPHLGTT